MIMITTEDLLKDDPWDAIINVINDEFGYQLIPATTQLTSFIPTEDHYVTFSIDRLLGSNSANLLPPLTVKEFSYKRLNLKYLVDGANVFNVAGLQLPATTFQVMETLAALKGFKLTKKDVVADTLISYGASYTIRAHSESLRFYGSVVVTVSGEGRIDISTFPDKQQPHTNYIENLADVSKYNGCYYTHTYDFTEHREYLLTLGGVNKYPDAIRLASLLANVTGKPFKAMNGLSEHNLVGTAENGILASDLIYNGKVIPKYSHRQDLNRCIVIKMNPTYCNDITGHLVLHYQ